MIGLIRPRAWCLVALTAATLITSAWSSVYAQGFPGGPSLTGRPPETLPPPNRESLPAPSPQPEPVAKPVEVVEDVRVLGNQSVPLKDLQQQIKTRTDRPFDKEQVEEDVRRLIALRRFVTVDVTYQTGPKGGRIIVFRVVERPTLKYVKYVGNSVRDRTIEKQTNLKSGDAADPFMVNEAARKLEEWYQTKGFPNARVTVFEGDQPGDRGAVFLINEGTKQKVWNIEFVGNTIASDARLKTQVQSKTPILYLFKGEFDRKKVDEDVDKLTTYYRSLGFFRARIGREITMDEDQDWINLRFVIDEGPRYRVRNIQYLGNSKIETDKLTEKTKLKSGDFFDRETLNGDVRQIEDAYGSVGYVFAAVEPATNFMEEPGSLDLVYRIEEGARYRIGRIEVKIEGENPRTRRNTVLNRVSLYPGQLADIRELRDSERRLKASGLFLNDPAQGVAPRVVFKDPGADDTEIAKRGGGNFRGQSPDPAPPVPLQPGERVLNVELNGRLRPEVDRQGDEAPAVRNVNPQPVVPAAPRIPTQSYHLPQAPNPYSQIEPQSVTYRAQSPSNSLNWGTAPRVTTPNVQPQNYSAQPSGYSQPSTMGQVPLGRVDPDAFASRVNAASPPINQFAQVQYQQPGANPYVAPAQGYSQQPVYQQNIAPQQQGFGAPPSYPATQVGTPTVTVPPGYPSPALPSPPGAVQPYAPPRGPGVDQTDLYERGQGPFLPGETYSDGYLEPTRPLDVDVRVQETQTGRIQLGVGVNSNAGVVGQVLIDEQNFDWRRIPTSWEEVRNGTAFRGGGQQFRIEAVPGSLVSRYSVVYRDPYFLDTPYSLSLSGFYFNRYYQDWTEGRLGGRVGFGRQLTPDLSANTYFRGENVNISQPTVPTPQELQDILGDNALYALGFELIHDTRDSAFLATQGHYIKVGFEQTTGSFDYPRGTFEGRQYFLLKERPDRSGRHVLSLSTDLGISGTHTPTYENYFAGGFSSLRGFRFRGVTPLAGNNVQIGGRFQWVNSAEYMFPITADDMLRGVMFCDFGTVERSVKVTGDTFRVAVGAGLRIQIPAMGPAPIAIDFAAPVNNADGDQVQNFSFFVGYTR